MERELKDAFSSRYLVPHLQRMSLLMAKNETVFLVANRLTFVDIMLFSFIESVERELPLVVPNFALLTYHHAFMKELPAIKVFCASGRRF